MSGPTCQMYGSGVAVPCGECNMVLLDAEEYAALRARVAELEAALSEATTVHKCSISDYDEAVGAAFSLPED